MNAVFADTVFFLATLNKRDAMHDQAVSVSRSLLVPRVTTAWVLTEVANSLALARQHAFFVELYDTLQKHPQVRIVPPTRELFARGIELYSRRTDKDWSLTDCISFAVMTDERIADALTSDRHFEQAGFTILLK